MLSKLYHKATDPLRKAAGPALRGAAMLAAGDPARLDSEPSDAETGPQMPQGDDAEALVQLVLKRFGESSAARAPHDRTALLCLAMEKGNQWVDWLGGEKLGSLIDAEDKYRTYLTVNLIHPLVAKNVARATSSNPDVDAKPLTPAPINLQAAEEAALVLAHTESAFRKRALLQSKVYWALVVGGAWEKLYWDPEKKVDVPRLGPDGQMTGKVPARSAKPAGDLCKDVVPALEIFADPHAPSEAESLWMIHAKRRPLSYAEGRWPDTGAGLTPDADLAGSGYEQRLASINEGAMTGSRQGVTIYEMWERPTPKFPQGRVAWVAGGRLLAYDTLENYDGDIPLVPLVYQETLGSPFPRGLVADLVPLQRKYNEGFSRILDRLNTDFPTVLIPEGSEVTPDAYTSGRNYRKLYFKQGFAPTYQVPPPPGEYQFRILEMLWSNMQDIAGVHDVSQGTLPSADLAASAIEMLQQSDTTQMKAFLTNIEAHDQRVAEWEIYFYGKYATKEPRLWEIGDGDEGGQAYQLSALGQGECRVAVTPGSATPKLPAAERDVVLKMLQAGAFNPPNLPGLKIALSVLKIFGHDDVYDELDKDIDQAMAQAKAMQPGPPPPPDPAVQAQLQAQIQAQQDQMQQQHEAELTAAAHQHAQDLEQIKVQGELELLHAKQQGTLQQTHLAATLPKIALSGNMDPSALVDAERQAGLTGDPETAKKMALPTPPATGNPAGKTGTTGTKATANGNKTSSTGTKAGASGTKAGASGSKPTPKGK